MPWLASLRGRFDVLDLCLGGELASLLLCDLCLALISVLVCGFGQDWSSVVSLSVVLPTLWGIFEDRQSSNTLNHINNCICKCKLEHENQTSKDGFILLPY